MNHQTPTDARRAASLMLLRDAADGIEVLMLRRAERDGDLRSGACVFPGGVLDPADRQARVFTVGPDDAEASAWLGLPEGGLDYLVAAVRESFEEVGLLLACDAAGQPVDVAAQAQALHPWRDRLQDGQASMADLCEDFGFHLDLRGLRYYSHWLTPPGVRQRFDTRFFVVPAPPGQTAQADLGEAVELMWTTPRKALARDSGYRLLPVTRRTLEQLGAFDSSAAAHAHVAARGGLPLTMPRLARGAQGLRILLPEDHAYAEVGRLDPEGALTASAEIVAGQAVRLSARVWRVTAPNAGMMTGPGTNSYLVMDPAGEACALIDPGPLDEVHVQALIAAAPAPITQVLVTHTHIDHSPGAAALQRATGARLVGRAAPVGPSQDPSFLPDHQPGHGERISLGPTTTLQVLHTPGHASNHQCYLLEQERTLFTGDHVMQGSTVVINPPDGNMGDYLRSLRDLLDQDLEWLAPGHGFLVAEPHAVMAALIEHRLKREALVRQALQAHGPGPVSALVPAVYADVPAARHALAERSLLAHLHKLRDDGVAAERDGVWSAL